jgi:uncharacterized protein (TIGR02147 family)
MGESADISYREMLGAVHQQRQAKNKNYSLRAFARDLELDPGQLSLVLKGKKNISLSKASELAKKLFQGSREMLVFYHAVELEHAASDEQRDAVRAKLRKLRGSHAERDVTISEDEFEVISNWYNLPILELTALKGLEVTPKLAAEYFGIPELDAMLGLEAMRRLGFVKKSGGAYQHVKNVVTTTEVPSLAIRRFHHQMIAKAQEAIFQQSIDKRYLSGLTLAIPREKLEEVKKMIVEHEQRLSEFAQSLAGQSDKVIYQVNSQLFSLRAEDSHH